MFLCFPGPNITMRIVASFLANIGNFEGGLCQKSSFCTDLSYFFKGGHYNTESHTSSVLDLIGLNYDVIQSSLCSPGLWLSSVQTVCFKTNSVLSNLVWPGFWTGILTAVQKPVRNPSCSTLCSQLQTLCTSMGVLHSAFCLAARKSEIRAKSSARQPSAGQSQTDHTGRWARSTVQYAL